MTGMPTPSEEPSKALHLSSGATGELASLLRSVLGDLSSEIADTDNASYRRALLERRHVIEGIARQLAPSGSSAPRADTAMSDEEV